jgi:alpha-beta hydrolase superfamily lysophospholipase
VRFVAIMGLLCVGCASFERVTTPPYMPPNGTWLQADPQTRLYFDEQGTSVAWGVVYFVQGPEIRATEPYPTFTSAAHAAGLATATIHPRGTGFSDGLRGDLDDYRRFLADLQLGLTRLHERFPGRCVFLFGHSAGATLALHVAATTQVPLAGVVLVNPAYKLKASEGLTPSFTDYVTYAFNLVFRRSALTVDMNSNPKALKNAADREEGFAMQRDPLVVRSFSMRYLLAQREVMNASATNVATLHVPLVLVQGADDALVDPQGNDEILSAAKTPDAVKLIAERGGHGASAVETMAAPLVDWLRAHRCPTP